MRGSLSNTKITSFICNEFANLEKLPPERANDMKKVTIQVNTEVGLHARPAALFVKQAGQFESVIQIRNLTTSSKWANAKSILSVLSLGVEKDFEIELEANGQDEQAAIEALTAMVLSDFGERPIAL